MAGLTSSLGVLGLAAETAVAAFLALIVLTWLLRRRAVARAPASGAWC